MTQDIVPYLFQNTEIEFAEGQPWLSQRGLVDLFGAKSVQAINYHIKNFKKSHADYVQRVIKKSLITASDGKTYEVEIYNLKVITYVGYRLNETAQTLAFQEWVDDILLSHVQEIIAQNDALLLENADLQSELSTSRKLNRAQRRAIDNAARAEYDEYGD